MRAPGLRALLLALVLASAGCVGGDEEPPTAAAAGSEAGGADSAAAPTAAEELTDKPAEPPAPVETPFAHDGTISTSVIACESAVTQGCQGTGMSDTAGFDLPWTGNLTGFALEVSWSAASPATETLAVHVFTCAPDEEGGTQCEALAAAEGASPLVLDAQGLDIGAGTLVRGFAYRPSELPSSPVPAFVHYQLEQAFHVEGTLAAVPPA